MKTYNKIILGLVALSGLFLTSCNDYLDENESPNDALIGDIPPNQRLSGVQTEIFRVITGDNQNYGYSVGSSSLNQLGMIWSGAWSANAKGWTGAYTEEYTGDITNGFYTPIWDWTYLKTMNLQNIINYESDNYDNHKAIAMILKSFYMQYMVDLYGDVPYTEAWALNPTPAYDDQKVVYRALYEQINEAIELIDNTDYKDVTVGAEDAMFSGDMSQWRRFGNTLKLRFLLRQSQVTDSEISSFVSSEMASLSNADFLETDATINPGYSASSSDNQNPFYGRYGFNHNGDQMRTRTLPTASAYLANEINSGRTNDPRRSSWFTVESDGNVLGVAQGIVGTEAPEGPAKIGPAFIPEETSVGSALDGYVMSLSEVKFLLAEAAQRYGGFPASAEQYFNQGVEASFTRFGISSSFATYQSGVSTLSGYGWGATADKIEVIMNQKWLALLFTNGMESYLDRLRTGYPNADLPLTNSRGTLPKRLMYPSSETGGNTANVPSITRDDCYAAGAFWVPTN